MLARLFELADIDAVQWRALVRAAFLVDLRTTGGGAFGQRSGATSLLWVVLFYLTLGAVFAFLAYAVADVFLGATIFLTYVAFAVALAVLMDYHAVVTSPDDYVLLGYQPISSRTYFAARLTNLVAYTSLITGALALLPSIAYGLRRPPAGVAAFVTAEALGLATALVMVAVYAALVRLVSPDRLRRALSYAQLLLSFLVYGGYAFIPELLDARAVQTMTLERQWWMYLHPATWYASVVQLAHGPAARADGIGLLAAVLATALSVRSVAGRFSLEFSERLGRMTTTPAGEQTRSDEGERARFDGGEWAWFEGGWSRVFHRAEARAVALLVRAQFRHDQKFRLGILSIAPLTCSICCWASTAGR